MGAEAIARPRAQEHSGAVTSQTLPHDSGPADGLVVECHFPVIQNVFIFHGLTSLLSTKADPHRPQTARDLPAPLGPTRDSAASARLAPASAWRRPPATAGPTPDPSLVRFGSQFASNRVLDHGISGLFRGKQLRNVVGATAVDLTTVAHPHHAIADGANVRVWSLPLSIFHERLVP